MLKEKKYRAECEVFDAYLSKAGIRKSVQRYNIMKVFLDARHHITVADLLELVKKRYPSIGTATVYRTIRLFCDAGIAQEVDIGDGVIRYEHKLGHEHHDHLVCNECGIFIETKDDRIEKLQEELAEKHGFSPLSHRLQIFGICKKCSEN